jgi:hypothetical protein
VETGLLHKGAVLPTAQTLAIYLYGARPSGARDNFVQKAKINSRGENSIILRWLFVKATAE